VVTDVVQFAGFLNGGHKKLSLLLVKACPQRGTLQGVQCTPTPLIFEALYSLYFKLHVRWLLSLLGPSMGLASTRPLQAAFKSAPDRFVTRIID
ncbi:hypothetical protein ACMWOT_001133, partial [Yersinia enterocolitica]